MCQSNEFFHWLPGNFIKNQELGFYGEDEHKKMNLISCLKAFFISDLPLASYGIVYCILAMVTRLQERNILYFFRFFIYHPRTGSSSTGFTLLKLRSKDSFKRSNFCICHLRVMVCCFEIKKAGTQVPYIILIIFFVFRVLCRK